VILPGVGRINQTGAVLAGALPLLVEAAEAATAKLAPPQEVPRDAAPRAVLAGVVTSMHDTDIESLPYLISASHSRDRPTQTTGWLISDDSLASAWAWCQFFVECAPVLS
jgi:hypothetical protein